MISYDTYKNRIMRIAKVKRFVSKYKFLFIGIFTLLIALLSAFLICKGMITTAMTLPAQIIYGEEYEPTKASALFSPVSYEYSLEGSDEWSAEKPVTAGKYLARTVTSKSFSKGYSTPVKFEILPRETQFTISDSSLVYGSAPKNYSFPLVSGDVLVKDSISYEVGELGLETTTVCVDASSLIIKNSDGSDRTSCYSILAPEASVKLIAKSITVSPAALEVVYSGAPVNYESAADKTTINSLATGDDISLQTEIRDANGTLLEAMPQNAGVYTVEITEFKITKNGNDVTACYDVTELSSLLKISKRPVTITTLSDSKVFDGTPLIQNGFNCDGVVEGHTVKAVSEERSITDFGSIVNDYSFVITDSANSDLSDNYSISYKYGILSIEQKPVTITTGSGEKVYNGVAFNKTDGVKVEGLLSGYTARLDEDSITTVTDAGTYDNILNFTIVDSSGDTTENFSINYSYGKLTVACKTVTILTGGGIKVYNGKPLYNDEAEINGVLSGHSAVVYNLFTITDVAEDVENTTEYRIFDETGNDLTPNYSLEYSYGLFTVLARPILITTPTATKVYDGTPLFDYSDYATSYYGSSALSRAYSADGEDDAGLVGSDTLTVLSGGYSQITDVGTIENKCAYTAGGNYKIELYVYGELTVEQRHIVVVTGSSEKVYDGEELTAYDYNTYYTGDYSLSGLVGGDELTRINNFGITNAGSAYNECDYKDDSGNYFIERYEYGTLTVTPRPITIVTASNEKVYDGYYFSDKTYETYYTDERGNRLNGLLNNDKLNVTSSTEILNVADSNWNIFYSLELPDGGNYSVYGYEYGTLTITRLKATVKLSNVDDVMYGSTFSYPSGFNNYANYGSAECTLADGEELQVAVYYTRPGSSGDNPYYPKDDDYIFIDPIDPIYPVIPLDGGVALNDVIDFTIIDSGYYAPVSGESTNVFYRSPIYVGEYYVIPDTDNWLIYRSRHNDFTDLNNYDFECYKSEKTSLITQRNITITTKSLTKVYDGEYLFGSTPEISAPGFAYDDTVFVINIPMIVDAGSITNNCSYSIVNGDSYNTGNTGNTGVTNVADVTYNYLITYKYGTLTVTPRPLTVYTPSEQKVYDGTPLYSYTDYTTAFIDSDGSVLWGLLDSDELTVADYASAVDAGSYTNECIYTVPNKNYYIADYDYGTLTVTPRPLTVVTATSEKFYDGLIFYNTDYTTYYVDEEGNYLQGLINEDKLTVKQSTKVTDADVYQNVVEYAVPNGNYEIIGYEYGTLLIKPRPVTVVVSDISSLYGEPVNYPAGAGNFANYSSSVNGYEKCDLVNGEKLEISVIFGFEKKPPDVGTYTITAAQNKTVITGGRERLENYAITYIDGTLSITPRTLTVTLEDLTAYYGNTVEYPDCAGNYKALSGDGLANGENVKIPSVSYVQYDNVVTPRNVGEYEIIANNANIVLPDGSTTDASNYKIDFISGTLKITPRSILIVVNNLSVTYGDEMQYPSNTGNYANVDDIAIGDVSYRKCDLAYGEQLAIAVKFDLENDKPSVGVYKEKINLVVSDCTVFDANAQILENGISNYSISWFKGTLTITPRPITVVVSDLTVSYGDEIKYPSGAGNFANAEEAVVNYAKCDLAYGDTLEISVSHVTNADMPNVGTYPITAVEEQTKINGLPDTGNYNITYVDGTLTVKVRRVTVVLSDIEDVTYGETFTYPSGIGNFANATNASGSDKCDLAYGEQLEVGVVYSIGEQTFIPPEMPLDAGNYEYAIYIPNTKIYGAGDNPEEITDGLSNYDITCLSKSATILKRKITVELNSFDDVVYGETFTYASGYNNYANYGAENCLLAEGEELQVAVLYRLNGSEDSISSPVYVGDYSVVPDTENCTIRRNRQNDVTNLDNYSIDWIYGKAAIKQRDITISTPTRTYVYSAIEISDSTPEITGSGLAYNDKIKVIDYATITDVGSISNVCTYYIYDGETVLTENYNISFNYGKLTVIARTLTVYTADDEKVYDGEELYNYDGYRTVHFDDNGSESDGLLSDDKLTVESYTKITDAGEVENVCVYSVPNGNYKIIKYVNGTLTVTPRPIIIVTGTDEKVYDGNEFSVTDYDTYYVDEDGNRLQGLLNGDELSGIVSTTITNVIESGSNEFKEFELPSSNNYSFAGFENGTITIKPRSITVELNDLTFDYGETVIYPDGSGNYKEITGDYGLVDGESFEITAVEYFTQLTIPPVTPKNAGNYIIGAASAVIHMPDGSETDTQNYSVSYVKGTLQINKLNITISLNEMEDIVYDAQSHPFDKDGYEIEEGSFAYDEILSVAVIYYSDEARTVKTIPFNAGTYYIEFDPANSKADDNYSRINYNITCTNDITFTILQKSVTIILGDVESIYDGNEYDFSSADETAFKVTGLCSENESVLRTVSYDDIPLNAGTYTITFQTDKFTVKGNNADVSVTTRNYFISEDSVLTSTLTIKKREITVVVNDRQVEYNGLPVNPEDESFYSYLTADSSDGFVVGDELKVKADYSYDSEQIPVSVGNYTVSVSFEDDDVTANYIITYESGTLTIEPRNVSVQVNYYGDGFVYNGEPISLEDFDYAHWHTGKKAESGFADGDEPTFVEYVFTDESGNELSGAPVNAGKYTVSISLDGYSKADYLIKETFTCEIEVKQRAVEVVTDDMVMVYSNSEPSQPELYEQTGILDKDLSVYSIIFIFTVNGEQVARYNVGTYEITPVLSSSDGTANYFVSLSEGSLEIVKRTLFIRPVEKTVPYTGESVELNAWEYVIFGTDEDGNECSLADGDILAIKANNMLTPTKSYVTLKVESYTISDSLNGADVSANYNVHYSADSEAKEQGYYSYDFTGELSYVTRTVYFNQIRPEAYSDIYYTGEKLTVTSDSDSLFEDVSNIHSGENTGLYGNDYLVVYKSQIGPYAGVYKDWLTLRVYNQAGQNVTANYNLVLCNGEDSAIEIKTLALTVTIDENVTKDTLSDGSCTVYSEFYSRYVLADSAYEVSGLIAEHRVDVVVFEQEDGSFVLKAVVYQLKISATGKETHTDMSDIYNVNLNAPDGLHVELAETYDF